MSEWLDTETKAILEGAGKAELAPPDTQSFTLVLLSKSSDQDRLRQALAKAGCSDPATLRRLLASPCPCAAAAGLTLEEAMFGQFELACCDRAAVFLRDDVVAENDLQYLSRLYDDLALSEEFRPAEIEIHFVPRDEHGARYVRQFLGVDERFLERVGLPLQRTVMEKKARMMWHWGKKIERRQDGGIVSHPKGCCKLNFRNWFRRKLRIASREELTGLRLNFPSCWAIAAPRWDPVQGFRALPKLLDGECTLVLEGGSHSEEVLAFLETRQVAPREQIPRGTIWPRQEAYHLPATAEVFDGLSRLADHHAAPEICFHLVIYRPPLVLVDWYDAFDREIYASCTIPEQTVREFAEMVGASYRIEAV